ncbi:hypothetical protein, partial [Methylobacterium haplocladii]|uniref:hypothetical protein n=3 Tax=Pseudomonadota TaxID=1224 RepID=UPI0024E04A3D
VYLFLFTDTAIRYGYGKERGAIVGFLMGQLVLVFSIYHPYLPRVLTTADNAVPLIFYLVVKHYRISFFDTRSSTGRVSSLFVFLAYLMLQFVNPFLLPSSLRFLNGYHFRSDNQILFIIGHWWGFVIGHIIVLKSMDSNLVFLTEKVKKVKLEINKFLLRRIKKYVTRGFTILVFVTFFFSLARVSLPIFINTLNRLQEVRDAQDETEEEGDAQNEKRRDAQDETEPEAENQKEKKKRELNFTPKIDKFWIGLKMGPLNSIGKEIVKQIVLGQNDSNPGVPGPKLVALPLGHAPFRFI